MKPFLTGFATELLKLAEDFSVDVRKKPKTTGVKPPVATQGNLEELRKAAPAPDLKYRLPPGTKLPPPKM